MLTINAADWNTIIGTSRVAQRVKSVLPPSYQHNATTAQRFQYLADQLAGLGAARFDAFNIAGSPSGARWIDLGAVINTTACAEVLDRLDITIVDRTQPRYVVAAGTFFTGAYSAQLITPNTVSFIKFNLILRHSVHAQGHLRRTKTMFHYVDAPQKKGCH